MISKVRKDRVLFGDPDNLHLYLLFLHAFRDQEDIPNTITSIRNAFSILLSDSAREELGLEKITEKPTQETRKKIDTLIRFMNLIPPKDFCGTE